MVITHNPNNVWKILINWRRETGHKPRTTKKSKTASHSRQIYTISFMTAAKLSESKQTFWKGENLLRHKRLSRQIPSAIIIFWHDQHTQKWWQIYWLCGFLRIFFSFSILSLSTNDLDINPSFATCTKGFLV